MGVADLGSRRVAVWGLGREGRAAIKFLREHHPRLPLLLLDDAADAHRRSSSAGILNARLEGSGSPTR
jgi:UDP-N-acetylmuramoylalanine--D-glutamate ligase